MGKELAAADSLTAGLPSEIPGWLLDGPVDERELDDARFSVAVMIAAGPAPQVPMPEKNDIRAHLAPLAGTLKSRSGTSAQGRMQLAIYWRVLADIPVHCLARAALYFAANSEWMPTPAEVRRQALKYTHPAELAFRRARSIVAKRHERIHRSLMLAARQRRLTQEQIDGLPAEVRQDAIAQRLLVPTPDGGAVYPSREAWQRWAQHRKDE